MGLFGKRKKKKQGAEETDKEPKKWSDIGEEDKFVIQGGKVQCPFCSVPIADVVVTSNTISLQGKYYATIADNNGQINLDFKGQCTAAPGISKPPCKSVIQLGKWKDYSDTFINDDNALLVRSTIPCNFGGIDIKIINSGQIEVLTEIEPDVVKNPRVTRLIWMDKEENERIKQVRVNQEVILYAITKDYEPQQSVTIKLLDNETGKEYILNGIVDEDKIARIKWKYESETHK